MNNIETMKLALEALERCVATCFDQYAHHQVMSRPEHFVNQTITALRQAIEQAQQAEPDYYGLTKDHLWMSITKDHYDRLKPEFRMACYTSPPPRQPLTDEEERKAFEDYAVRTICNPVELQRERLGGYSSQELNYLWRGWKARAAHGIKGEA